MVSVAASMDRSLKKTTLGYATIATWIMAFHSVSKIVSDGINCADMLELKAKMDYLGRPRYENELNRSPHSYYKKYTTIQ